MNRIAIILIVAVVVFFWVYFYLVNWAESSEVDFTAKEVVAQSWENFRFGVETELEEAEIEIVYETGKVEKKTLIRRTLYQSDKEDKVSIEFTAPRREEGLKLLIWRNIDSPDNIWLKMPSWNRARPVSGRNEGRFFAGTDFTFRDAAQLTGENIVGYGYELLGSSDEYWKVEALPKEEIEAIYSKRIFYIKRDSLAIKKIEYFQDEKLEKTQYNCEIEWHDQAWRPKKIIIKNEFQDRTTEFRIVDRKIDSGIPIRFWRRSFLR
jgi:hypothetical protein